jgi:predicted metal-dependent hydrolase
LTTGDRVKRPAIIQWLFPELAEQEPVVGKPPKVLVRVKQPEPIVQVKPKFKPEPEVLFQETLSGIGQVIYVRAWRARQLRVTLRPGKPVSVTVPRGESVAHARQFLRNKKAWIGRHLAMFRQFAAQASWHKGPVETLEQSCRRIVGRLGELSSQHGLAYSGVTFRHQKTRWGSCNRNNRLSLNLGLALLPPELLDYVLLHELLHTRIKNHGKAFWAELAGMMPDARARAVQLRDHRPT